MKRKSNFRLPFFKRWIFRMKSLRSPFSSMRVMLSEAIQIVYQFLEIWKERLSYGSPVIALGLLGPPGHTPG